MSVAIFASMILTSHAVGRPPEPIPATGLTGKWESDCLPIGRGGRHGFVTRIRIDGDRIDAQSQVYTTSNCQTQTFKLTYNGEIVQRQTDDGKVLFQHRVQSITLTPQAEAVVVQYNREDGERHGCGLNGWQINVAKSVAGESCAPFSFAAEQTILHDVAWIDGDNHLRFGAFPMLWTNSSSDRTPAHPLENLYHRMKE